MADTTLAALFVDTVTAEAAERSLAELDIAARKVRVFQPRTLHEQQHVRAVARSMMIGFLVGLVIGAALGHVATLAASPYGSVTAGVGSILPVILFGIMGAAAGATVGAMFAMDATSDPALYLAQEVDAGRALLSVTVDAGQAPAVVRLLRGAGAFDVIDAGHGEEAKRLAGG